MILSANPEYEKLVFPMSSDEYNTLKESIKQDGLWIPIICNAEGVILDGHHRFRACIELKIKTKAIVREFENNYHLFHFHNLG